MFYICMFSWDNSQIYMLLQILAWFSTTSVNDKNLLLFLNVTTED